MNENKEILLVQIESAYYVVSIPALKCSIHSLVQFECEKKILMGEVIYKWWNPDNEEINALELISGFKCCKAIRSYSQEWEQGANELD